MPAPEEINADMLAFWNGKGGDIWVARQEHTDITLAPVTDVLLVFAGPRVGERVVDIGCGCGVSGGGITPGLAGIASTAAQGPQK
jgi:hypothetical protein